MTTAAVALEVSQRQRRGQIYVALAAGAVGLVVLQDADPDAIGALGFAIPDPTPVATIAPSTIYDTALAAVLGPLAVAVRDRHAEVERADW